jgi:hypothetical protein
VREGEPVLFHGFAQRHRLTAIVAAVSVVSIMTSAGCGTAASHASGPAAGGPMVIVVRGDANGKAVSARAGDRIELILSSSYWHVTGSSAPSVLRQDGPPVLLSRPSSCPKIPGLGCVPVRADFTVLTDGKAVITASRSACGEALRCKPDQTRFTVIVVVRNQSLPRGSRSSAPRCRLLPVLIRFQVSHHDLGTRCLSRSLGAQTRPDTSLGMQEAVPGRLAGLRQQPVAQISPLWPV